MMVRAGSGWQTLLADLSIILFMVTASAVSQQQAPAKAAQTPTAARFSTQASAQAEPLAVWRAGAGAPPLAQWLKAQSPDPRQQLTITAFYAAGGRAAALAEVDTLARQAGDAGARVRIVIEPGNTGGTTASLAYDTPDVTLAQGLLVKSEKLVVQGLPQ